MKWVSGWLIVSMVCSGSCFADNVNTYNEAMQLGQQNKFNLNLNQNSTLGSYVSPFKFESSIANTAADGNAGARDMYTHVNKPDGTSDPNYLYNAGSKEITDCQNKHDPRCTTLNKYGDKDTQTQLQAYSSGISGKYLISVRPDPNDSVCSYIKTRKPINPTSVTCEAALSTKRTCNIRIIPRVEHRTVTCSVNDNSCNQYSSNPNCSLTHQGSCIHPVNYYECEPTSGACNQYSANPQCTLTRPYVAGGKCATWFYEYYAWSHEKVSTYNFICQDGSLVTIPPEVYPLSPLSGVCNGVKTGKFVQVLCTAKTELQLAQYMCTDNNTCQNNDPSIYDCTSTKIDYGDQCQGLR